MAIMTVPTAAENVQSPTAHSVCAPAMVLAVDQPTHAIQFKNATPLAPQKPHEKRDEVIWRRPRRGPKVEQKAGSMAAKMTKKKIVSLRQSQT